MKYTFVCTLFVCATLGDMRRASAATTMFSQPPTKPAAEGGELIAFYSQDDTSEDGIGLFQRSYDDFTLDDELSITYLSWRGAYDRVHHQPIEQFTVTFWEHAGDQPGTSLLEQVIAGNANETFVGEALGLDPDVPVRVYDYSAQLSTPFQASANTTYWMSIVATVPTSGDDDGFWGWHAGEGGNANLVIDLDQPEFDGMLEAADDRLFFDSDLAFSFPQTELQPGDANQDGEFNQFDLIQIQIAGKYRSGQAATWGEGDWDGAPGGSVGNPPHGNGFFDQVDIVAALSAGVYLSGPYWAINPGGNESDEQTSIVYHPATGELSVNAPASTRITSINIDSVSAIFTGDAARNLGGSFDNDTDNNIFKATFGSSFGSLSFGKVARPDLPEDFVLNDLTVVGSLAGGGDLGNVDLIYVPEPTTLVLLTLGLLGLVAHGIGQRSRHVT